MKSSIWFKIINKVKSKPELKRKVKIFSAISLVGVLFVSAMTIWAGISAYKYIATSVNQGMTSSTVQTEVQNLQTELKQIQFQPISCWNKAQSLFAVQPWIERTLLDNLQNLKIACLDDNPIICEGHDCNQMKQNMNTAKGVNYDSN